MNNGAYGTKISSFCFWNIDELNLLKQEPQYKRFKNNQQKLHQHSKLATPTKDQNRTCTNKGSNTTTTRKKTTQNSNDNHTPDTTSLFLKTIEDTHSLIRTEKPVHNSFLI
jgi:hypothetical protein